MSAYREDDKVVSERWRAARGGVDALGAYGRAALVIPPASRACAVACGLLDVLGMEEAEELANVLLGRIAAVYK